MGHIQRNVLILNKITFVLKLQKSSLCHWMGKICQTMGTLW